MEILFKSLVLLFSCVICYGLDVEFHVSFRAIYWIIGVMTGIVIGL